MAAVLLAVLVVVVAIPVEESGLDERLLGMCAIGQIMNLRRLIQEVNIIFGNMPCLVWGLGGI